MFCRGIGHQEMFKCRAHQAGGPVAGAADADDMAVDRQAQPRGHRHRPRPRRQVTHNARLEQLGQGLQPIGAIGRSGRDEIGNAEPGAEPGPHCHGGVRGLKQLLTAWQEQDVAVSQTCKTHIRGCRNMSKVQELPSPSTEDSHVHGPGETFPPGSVAELSGRGGGDVLCGLSSSLSSSSSACRRTWRRPPRRGWSKAGRSPQALSQLQSAPLSEGFPCVQGILAYLYDLSFLPYFTGTLVNLTHIDRSGCKSAAKGKKVLSSSETSPRSQSVSREPRLTKP